MQSAPSRFSEHYRELPDEEIAALFADVDSLTVEARSALMDEIERRRLAGPQLQQMHSIELLREAQFDRLEKSRRKIMIFKDLGLNDPRGWIVALLGAGILMLIEKVASSHH